MRVPTLNWEVGGNSSSIQHLHTDRKKSLVLPKFIIIFFFLNWTDFTQELWAQLSKWCQWCSRQLWRSMQWKACAEASRKKCSTRVSQTWPLGLPRAGKILREERFFFFFFPTPFSIVSGERRKITFCVARHRFSFQECH